MKMTMIVIMMTGLMVGLKTAAWDWGVPISGTQNFHCVLPVANNTTSSLTFYCAYSKRIDIISTSSSLVSIEGMNHFK